MVPLPVGSAARWSGDGKMKVGTEYDKMCAKILEINLLSLQSRGMEIPDKSWTVDMESGVHLAARPVATPDSPAGVNWKFKWGDFVEFLDNDPVSGGGTRHVFLQTVYQSQGTIGVRPATVRDLLVNRAWEQTQSRNAALAGVQEGGSESSGVAAAVQAPKKVMKKVMKKGGIKKGNAAAVKALKKVKKGVAMKAMK